MHAIGTQRWRPSWRAGARMGDPWDLLGDIISGGFDYLTEKERKEAEEEKRKAEEEARRAAEEARRAEELRQQQGAAGEPTGQILGVPTTYWVVGGVGVAVLALVFVAFRSG